ncbi:MAG TPA: hypothetical protein VNG31_02090 [Candidatus Baltobacteraceae bacterium]|nr:hypothetical protein [Candidatus Baltobacteraceae bacterium]
MFAFALDAGVPPLISFDEPCAAKRGHGAAFAQFNAADARNRHLRLCRIELQRPVAVRERDLLPAICRFESRESRRFASLATPKKGLHGKIETAQGGILTFAINGGYASIEPRCGFA